MLQILLPDLGRQIPSGTLAARKVPVDLCQGYARASAYGFREYFKPRHVGLFARAQMFQVRIHGRGGQGVVTAAEFLAVAAYLEHRHAQAFPSFGSERTGAPVVAYCRIDDKEIRLREPILEPDAVIVQDPNSGAILAMANWPRFNPNAATNSPDEARMNRAISAIYEPGSTFKLITLAAAFDQGLIRAEEVFDCENGAVTVAGHLIHDHKRYGMLTVADILANSSDVGAIKIALRLGSPKFFDYIKGFGFGTPTGVDLPGESRGLLHRLDHWGSYSIASVSMGQEVGVTPLQIVTAVSAIANGGLLYKPYLVQKMMRGNQVLAFEGPETDEAKRVVRPETAATLRRLMEGVILHGTGKAARLDGWTAAGKTGTAQKIDPATGRYSPKNVIASFAGFAPVNNPAVTVLVTVDSPGGFPHDGATVAAPVFKKIAEQVLPYLDVARDVPFSPQLMQTAYSTKMDDEAALDDLAPIDFSAPLEDTRESVKANSTQTTLQKLPEVMMAVDEGGDIAVPDFTGKTMREVTDGCLKLGLNPVLVGSNLAIQQVPAAGAKVRRGTKVTVQFGFEAGRAEKPH